LGLMACDTVSGEKAITTIKIVFFKHSGLFLKFSNFTKSPYIQGRVSAETRFSINNRA
jgi:hypothetical protein